MLQMYLLLQYQETNMLELEYFDLGRTPVTLFDINVDEIRPTTISTTLKTTNGSSIPGSLK